MMGQQECKTTLNFKRLETSWNAQFISRFHTVASLHPKQTVGSHSFGVAILINELWEDTTKNLIMAALYHDVPELILGDIPFTAKCDYSEIALAFEKAEEKVSEELELPQVKSFLLTDGEKRRLKMADMLDLVLYTHIEGRANKEMFDICRYGIDHLFKKWGEIEDFKPIAKFLDYKDLHFE